MCNAIHSQFINFVKAHVFTATHGRFNQMYCKKTQKLILHDEDTNGDNRN